VTVPPLQQANTAPQVPVNSPKGLDNTVLVYLATSGRSAWSISQSSTSAVHLVSSQSVPQAPLTVPENLFMESSWREASGALGVQYQVNSSNTMEREEFKHCTNHIQDHGDKFKLLPLIAILVSGQTRSKISLKLIVSFIFGIWPKVLANN